MSSRAIEFLLDLDGYGISAQRLSLTAGEARISSEWEALRREADRIARKINGVTENLPPTPTGEWPPPVAPQIHVPRGDEWLSLGEERSRLTAEARVLEESELPRVENVIDETGRELSAAEDRYAQLQRAHDSRTADLESERSQLASLEENIDSTLADLQRHKDLRTLRELGSEEALSLGQETCPTCHQSLDDNLIPSPTDQAVMGLDDNIAFLNDQLSAFRFMKVGSEKAISAKERAVSAGIAELNEVRGRIRDLKRTLVSDGRLPSQAAMRRRLTIEGRLEELELVEHEIARQFNAFANLSEEWRELQANRSRLPSGELSVTDQQKLSRFRDVFVEQLQLYGLRSLDASSLEISPDNYRPTHAGIDLQFDLSATDTIRTIWAYRLAFLQVGAEYQTNHPGFLIFDEPGQQEMASDSLAQFLIMCGRVAEGKQLIIATSEDEKIVNRALRDTNARILHFEDFILDWV